MARSLKRKKIDSRNARQAIPQSKAPHWVAMSRGRALGYRRGRNGGAWLARFDAKNFRREGKLGEADDDPRIPADGVQILDYAQALAKANEFCEAQLAEATGERPRSGPFLIENAIDDYVQSLKNADKADYQGAVYDFNRNTLPVLGKIEVERLTVPRLESWRAQLAGRRARFYQKNKHKNESSQPMTDDEKRQRQATANRSVRRLVAALNYAVNETRKTSANPKNWKIKPFKNAEEGRRAYLTESQQRDFVVACNTESDFQNLALAGLQTGCRLGELTRLRVRDFVPSSRTLYIHKSKSGKSRQIFLDDESAEFIQGLTINRGREELLLVRGDGAAWKKDDVKRPMQRACKQAQIAHMGFHQLRHSFTTRLLERGVPLNIVAKHLGHGSVRMIEKYYGHLQDTHVQKILSGVPSAGLNQAAKSKRGTVAVLPSRERSA